MEKLFTPNKWFVMFCAAFIVIFALLKTVSTARLQDAAKVFGHEVFSWVWSERNVLSSVRMTNAKIINSSDNSAVVEVTGEQTLSQFDMRRPAVAQLGRNVCKAKLTLYKMQNSWNLGQVEFE